MEDVYTFSRRVVCGYPPSGGRAWTASPAGSTGLSEAPALGLGGLVRAISLTESQIKHCSSYIVIFYFFISKWSSMKMVPSTACAGGRRGWSTAITCRGTAKHCPRPIPDADLSPASLFPVCRVQPLPEMVPKSHLDLGGSLGGERAASSVGASCAVSLGFKSLVSCIYCRRCSLRAFSLRWDTPPPPVLLSHCHLANPPPFASCVF